MGKKEHTREEIIQVLKEVDTEGKQPGRAALKRMGINQYWIQKLVPEGLTKLKQQLGLKISPQERPVSDDELLEKIDKVVSNAGRMPTWAQLRRETGITDKVFNQRFGKKGILGVFSHYRKWLEKHQPKSNHIKLVDSYLEGQGKTKISRTQPVKTGTSGTTTKWPKVSGLEYGPTLNFGNLIYEPTTHDCVIFLFGMVSKYLGFSIEHIGKEFPDCVAKQYIKGREGRQQTVKIEFEFRSGDYDHPLEGCDIIVCWEDNWVGDCPLKIIELRNEVKKLQRLPEFSRK
jgi:hypothetical protein